MDSHTGGRWSSLTGSSILFLTERAKSARGIELKKLRERRTRLGKKIAVKSVGEVVRAIRLTKNEK
jgi:hypothetical protein